LDAMAKLLGNEGGIQTGHYAYCRIGVTTVVRQAMTD